MLRLQMRSRRLNVIDLFAGCGGLSLGLERAGFTPVYVNELSDDARATYLRNRPHLGHLKKRFWSADIRAVVRKAGGVRLLVREIAKANKLTGSHPIDLIVGGPPCQGYSSAGLRRSYSVNKEVIPSNHLYKDMARFIKEAEPKAFLFENVEGLLRARWIDGGERGAIFKSVLKTFRGLKEYHVRYCLVRARAYGVPQNRPRVLIVGLRRKLLAERAVRSLRLNLQDEQRDAISAGFLPEGRARAPDLEEVLGDLAVPNFEYGGKTSKYRYPIPKSDFQKRMRRDDRPAGYRENSGLTEHCYSNHSLRIREKFQSMIAENGRIRPEFQTKKFRQQVLPRVWGESGPSITVTSLPDDFVHYELARSLTVRECARIQTFPDWYQFEGPRTTGGLRRAGNPREGLHKRDLPKYTQIANAVPPDLAEAVGNRLAEIVRTMQEGKRSPKREPARKNNTSN